MFKIGDTVRTKEDTPFVTTKDKGTIVEIDFLKPDNYLVQFETASGPDGEELAEFGLTGTAEGNELVLIKKSQG